MFRGIKNLEKIDYKVLLKGDYEYDNQEVNKCFQKWNKKYGLNISFDEDNSEQNNMRAVTSTIRNELKNIESDEDKVITSLVRYFYKKPSSKKKRLLWYTYGDWLYKNLMNNVGVRTICHKCGAVVNEKLVRGKCIKCRTKEVDKQGYKLIQCVDCGIDVVLPRNNKRTCRCEKCQEKDRQRQAAECMRNKRKN